MVERLTADGSPGVGASTAAERTGQNLVDFSQFEPLISDERVERIGAAMRKEYDKRVEGFTWVSFIQPGKTITPPRPDGLIVPVHVEPKAVFAVVAPDPRAWKTKADGILTASHLPLADWKDLEAERAHFVSGKQDLAFIPFLKSTLDVMAKVQSASEQIN